MPVTSHPIPPSCLSCAPINDRYRSDTRTRTQRARTRETPMSLFLSSITSHDSCCRLFAPLSSLTCQPLASPQHTALVRPSRARIHQSPNHSSVRANVLRQIHTPRPHGNLSLGQFYRVQSSSYIARHIHNTSRSSKKYASDRERSVPPQEIPPKSRSNHSKPRHMYIVCRISMLLLLLLQRTRGMAQWKLGPLSAHCDVATWG